MTLRRATALGLLAALALLVLAACAAMRDWPPPTSGIGGRLAERRPVLAAEGAVRTRIRQGETITEIMDRFGLPAQAVIEAARARYDLSRVRSEHLVSFRYERGFDHARAFTYEIDEDHTLLVEEEEPGAWSARVDEVVYEKRLETKRFTIRSCLWNAALDAGLRPDDITRLADIFQWDIDFNTELHDGDTFELVAEALYLEGTFRKLGAVHAVRLTTLGKPLVAVRHQHADGTVAYYDREGKARRRPFLRSPLAYSRVTSSFNPRGRFHPVLKKRRPHNGTDFGAPTGTPIRAVGDGVVSFAGNSGGYGLLVRIQHDSGHESGYAHMSVIQVRQGQRVRQGDAIGKVGTTGLSTGPHCHYELKLKGAYVDPMKTKLPVSIPLPEGERAAFLAARDRWLPMLDGAGPAAQAVTESAAH